MNLHKKSPLIAGGILALVIIGAAFFIIGRKQLNAPSSPNIEPVTQNSQSNPNSQPILTGPIRYNCELSGGSFNAGHCKCPLDEGVPGQSQETMYDVNTGFCQSTIGGPAGDAFNASVGLPYGKYAFWTQIVTSLCTNSGGNISGSACICPADKTYSKTTGKCE